MKRFWLWLWRKLDTPVDHFARFQHAGRKLNQPHRGSWHDLDTPASKDALRELTK